MKSAKYDRIRVSIYESNETLGAAAADDLADILRSTIAERGEASIIVATGNSQLTFMKALRVKQGIAWDRVTVFHMDEYLGMSDQHPASFRRYIREQLTDVVHPRTFYGIEGDAHAGTKNRQISLLAAESIAKMKAKGLNVGPGDFAENITTENIDLYRLKIGAQLRVGSEVILEISQIGKVCHMRCDIYYQAGDCVMPKEGIFARVVKGGVIQPGDIVEPTGGPDV